MANTCSKCGATNISYNTVTGSAQTKTNFAGPLVRLGRMLLIICTCGLWLLVPKRKESGRTKYKIVTTATCQLCGNSWEVR